VTESHPAPTDVSETRTEPRRLRIAIDNDHAEAVECTNGVIVAFWCEAQRVYAWAGLDALYEALPGAKLTWIDEETDHV
jgi:hypothetical protein